MKADDHPRPRFADLPRYLVRCIKFVVPEDLDVSGNMGRLCNQRNFKARFIAHNIDTDYRCCDELFDPVIFPAGGETALCC